MGTTPAHTVQTAQPSQPADIDALIRRMRPWSNIAPSAWPAGSRLGLPDDLISAGVLDCWMPSRSTILRGGRDSDLCRVTHSWGDAR